MVEEKEVNARYKDKYTDFFERNDFLRECFRRVFWVVEDAVHQH